MLREALVVVFLQREAPKKLLQQRAYVPLTCLYNQSSSHERASFHADDAKNMEQQVFLLLLYVYKP